MARKQTKSDKSISEILRPAQEALSLNPVFGPQVEQFWAAQEKMLDETETFTRHWFERRHEAARTALDAARKASASGTSDPAEAMQAMRDWQQHSMERMTADAREWFDCMARCAGHFVSGEMEASEAAVGTAAKQAGAAAKSKSSTPV
ncbi:phasin family protein [Roseovarius salinarum]|uniref:phasin family protein n=1 Tax=Roseovarius salinarum TaxID=1981892 RepID=UPI000C31C147|nr:phasin family protein [Roseovarius salinarum]